MLVHHNQSNNRSRNRNRNRISAPFIRRLILLHLSAKGATAGQHASDQTSSNESCHRRNCKLQRLQPKPFIVNNKHRTILPIDRSPQINLSTMIDTKNTNSSEHRSSESAGTTATNTTSHCITHNGPNQSYKQDGEEAREIAKYLPYFPFKGIPRFYDIGGFLEKPEVFQ